MNFFPYLWLKILMSIFVVNILTFIPLLKAQEKIYTVGVVPQFETRRLHTIWRPILQHLSKETGYQFEIKGSPSIPDFENDFLHGRYDFAYMNPYHMIMANKNQAYTPLLRDKGRTLYGVLVVKKEANIQSIAQLDGKKVAFPAPNAFGASLQMRQELYDIFRINIVPRYVKTHDSVYLNVLLGETIAGGGVQKTFNKQPSEYKHALKILHKTTPVASHPLAVHPQVPKEVSEAVKSALLKMGQTTEGKDMLAKIPMKKIGSASMDDYLPLQELKLERFYVKKK